MTINQFLEDLDNDLNQVLELLRYEINKLDIPKRKEGIEYTFLLSVIPSLHSKYQKLLVDKFSITVEEYHDKVLNDTVSLEHFRQLTTKIGLLHSKLYDKIYEYLRHRYDNLHNLNS